jgi:two-component system sensor histidine kinase UhpB
LKHAKAQNVDIILQMHPEKSLLKISVSDDGIGFDPNQVAAGIGISGMRERVLAWGGEFDLRSVVGQGTHIFIDLPVARNA